MAKARPLTLKQKRFAADFALHGNGVKAAKAAGYSDRSYRSVGVQAHDNLNNPKVASAINGELAKLALVINPERVRRRLDQISHRAEQDGQYGPAVRAEELLGKSIGMWIDQSLQLTGALSESHVTALVEAAKRRQLEHVDNKDSDDE